MRIALTIEYDGSNYCGWQRQKDLMSVQQELEEAIERLTGENITVHGAGRTDAGVHAIAQAAHFDTMSTIPPERFAHAMNAQLPKDISIGKSWTVDDSFHARFSAVGKRYRYIIRNAAQRSALNQRCMQVYQALDLEAMAAAAALIPGERDFAAFCASGSFVVDTVRRVDEVSVVKEGDYITVDVRGNGFLYNMVRIIAGTLVYAGLGKIAPGGVAEILKSKDRRLAGPTAPACGLFLLEVLY